jgi:glucose-6-phosphate-specific signal transduction histidine kinase|tara:strand:+ start:896 stop:1330 length:435 start_codon:yes stop_codon:yes gene_type:complete
MTLYPSRIKWILMLLVCIGLFVSGILLSENKPEMILVRLFLLVGGGLGIPLSVWKLWPNSNWLKLGPDGIREKVLFRKFHYLWSDLLYFEITTVQHRSGYSSSKTELVSFWIKTDENRHSLSECYGKKPKELVGILESYLSRYR